MHTVVSGTQEFLAVTLSFKLCYNNFCPGLSVCHAFDSQLLFVGLDLTLSRTDDFNVSGNILFQCGFDITLRQSKVMTPSLKMSQATLVWLDPNQAQPLSLGKSLQKPGLK